MITVLDCVKIFFAVLLPPIAVGLEKGWCTVHVLLNIVLTILGWLPGQIHACIVIVHWDKATDDDLGLESKPKPKTETSSEKTSSPALATASGPSQPAKTATPPLAISQQPIANPEPVKEAAAPSATIETTETTTKTVTKD